VTTKITVIYDNPEDADAFERAYPTQLALAQTIPGFIGLETSKVWPKQDGTPAPAYRLVDLCFPDYATASAAVTTPEAGELFPAISALATGGVRIAFAEIERAVGTP
jgi:uncharacterized protein (TIGR02118 family)